MAAFVESFVEVAGIVALSYLGIKALWGVWQTVRVYLLSGPLQLSVDFRNYAGKWAVVTGASDGIGKAYAEQLAARGMNIVLISRSEGKLKAVAAGIESKAGVQTKIVVADFGSTEIYDNIKQELEGLDIACLVNNVGTASPTYPDFFLNVEDKLNDLMVNVNVMSVIKMTSIVLPGMVQRKKGVVINISSTSGAVPFPLLTTYAGTEAFVTHFSRSLAIEYKKKGIIVQTVTPGTVSTNMSSNQPVNAMIPNPGSFVRSALKTVGLVGVTCGYFAHSFQLWIVGLFPQEMFATWVLMPTLQMYKNADGKMTQQKKQK
ncbi:very-long-chain 3-oxoacyl-CoA reductase-B-like [Branchiostoma floridae]|uniref:Very-long-chain 3-oxoacyl-CoA reductase-B-like n=1 Tax=Branchiostoma floridae TaxID=7739 RepID=A0A9J7LS66_BRAFL|nr:very-long-chain 3-oxoacyl-CoA reductase-B-like [Branchiostoma floridae]